MSAGDVGRNVDPSEGEVAQRAGGTVLFLLEEDVTPPLVVLCASLRIANVPVLCIVLSMLLIDVIAIGLVVISVVHGTSLPVLNLHIPNIFFARQPTGYLQERSSNTPRRHHPWRRGSAVQGIGEDQVHCKWRAQFCVLQY